MKESLRVGLERESALRVRPEMSPPHLPVKVLSTPAMIQMIEDVCLELAQEHLDPAETTVGVHVDVSHTGPANAGEEVTIRVRLAEINKRRLVFDVSVHSPRGAISSGRHQRAVIDRSRFG